MAVAGLSAGVVGLRSALAEEMVLSTGTYPLTVSSSGLRDGWAGTDYAGNLGDQFTVLEPLTVTALGYYDGPNTSSANAAGYTADGLNNSYVVGIYSGSTLMTSVTVTTTGTTAINDFQYVNLSTPLTLSAGSVYTIAALVPPGAESTSTGDVFYTGTANTYWGPGISTNFGGSTGLYSYGSTLALPTNGDGDGFFGPSFEYTVAFGGYNGGFTNPTESGYSGVSSNTLPSWDTAIVGWGARITNTANSGSAGIIHNTTFSTVFPGSTQAGYINASGNDIYEDLGALSPNTLYTVSFYEDTRSGSGETGGAYLLLGDTDAGTVVASTTFTAASSSAPGLITLEYLTGSTVSGDLTFELADVAGAGNQSIAFDDVNVIVVPEPASIGLISLLSFGLLRRGRRSRTPA